MPTPSWLIIHKDSGIVVDETFRAAEAEAVNADTDSKFRAVRYSVGADYLKDLVFVPTRGETYRYEPRTELPKLDGDK